MQIALLGNLDGIAKVVAAARDRTTQGVEQAAIARLAKPATRLQLTEALAVALSLALTLALPLTLSLALGHHLLQHLAGALA